MKPIRNLRPFRVYLFCIAIQCASTAGLAQVTQEIHAQNTTLLTSAPESLQPRLSRIANILVDRCVGCHDSQDSQGGYSMATAALLLTPGESKHQVIGSPQTDDSGRIIAFPQGLGEFWDRISTSDPELRMPKDSDALDPDQIEDIRAWIVTGAKVDGSMDAPLESFRPIDLPQEPKIPSYNRPHAVQAIAIDHAGRSVYASGYHEVLVWNYEKEFRLARRIPTQGRLISDLHWDPIQSLLWIASGEPGRIGYVESISLEPIHSDTSPISRRMAWVSKDTPLDLCVSPNGELLGIGNADGTIVVIDTLSDSLRWKMPAHAAAVTSIDWSRDSKTLLSSSRDRMAKSFEAKDGTMLSSFVDNQRTVASIVALTRGAVAFDEAGTARYYPNFTTPNARVLWGGFPQQTHKLISSNEDFFVIDSDRIKHFRIRREEVEVPEPQDKDKQDDKKEDKKKKKKTEFYIDEKPGIRLVDPKDSSRRVIPLVMQPSNVQVGEASELWIAIGCSQGEIFIWNPASDQLLSAINRP
jgi:WD40 repeat protein